MAHVPQNQTALNAVCHILIKDEVNMTDEEIVSAVRSYGENREEIAWKYIMQVCNDREICEAAAGSSTPEEAIEKAFRAGEISVQPFSHR